MTQDLGTATILPRPAPVKCRGMIAARFEAMIVARYYISGRVQGVGFRYFTEAAAAREGLHGWVRNLPDGRVEIVGRRRRGSDRAVRAHVRHGPPGARVERVDVDDADADRPRDRLHCPSDSS